MPHHRPGTEMKAHIALEGLSFYAYHGFYEEERRSGNRFSVDLRVHFLMNDNADADDLQNTVNYETLYALVNEVMQTPVLLLENVCRQILKKVFETWTFVESCEVSISKFHPSLGGPCERARVTLSESR